MELKKKPKFKFGDKVTLTDGRRCIVTSLFLNMHDCPVVTLIDDNGILTGHFMEIQLKRGWK